MPGVKINSSVLTGQTTTTTTPATTTAAATNTQQNKNSALGIIGRTITSAPSVIAKGATTAIDDLLDSPTYIKNAIAQKKLAADDDNALLKYKAKQAQKEYEQKRDTSVFGDKVREWENKVEEKQQSIVTDNPNSNTAKAALWTSELMESAGRMLPSIAVSAATAGIGGALTGTTTAAMTGAAAADVAAKTATKAAVASVAEKAGLAAMFGQVYTQSINASVAEGNDYTTSSKKAVADAAVEVATEMLFGGIAGLRKGEGLAGKAVNAIKKVPGVDTMVEKASAGSVGTALSAASTWLGKWSQTPIGNKVIGNFTEDGIGGLMGEALEEMISEVIGPIHERATTNPEAADATLTEVLLAGLGGALMSGMLAPIGYVGQAIETSQINNNIRKEIATPEGKVKFVDILQNGGIYNKTAANTIAKELGLADGAVDKTGHISGFTLIDKVEVPSVITEETANQFVKDVAQGFKDQSRLAMKKAMEGKYDAAISSFQKNMAKVETVDENGKATKKANPTKADATKAFESLGKQGTLSEENQAIYDAKKTAEAIHNAQLIYDSSSNVRKVYTPNEYAQEKYGARYAQLNDYQRADVVNLLKANLKNTYTKQVEFAAEANKSLKANGINVKFVKPSFFKNASTKTTPSAEYRRSDNTIYFNTNKATTLSSMNYLLSHELFHAAYYNTGLIGEENKKHLVSSLKTAMYYSGFGYYDVAERIQSQHTDKKGNIEEGYKVDGAANEEEVCAYFMSTFLSSDKMLDKVAENSPMTLSYTMGLMSSVNNKSSRILSTVQQLAIDNIRTALAYAGVSPAQSTAEAAVLMLPAPVVQETPVEQAKTISDYVQDNLDAQNQRAQTRAILDSVINPPNAPVESSLDTAHRIVNKFRTAYNLATEAQEYARDVYARSREQARADVEASQIANDILAVYGKYVAADETQASPTLVTAQTVPTEQIQPTPTQAQETSTIPSALTEEEARLKDLYVNYSEQLRSEADAVEKQEAEKERYYGTDAGNFYTTENGKYVYGNEPADLKMANMFDGPAMGTQAKAAPTTEDVITPKSEKTEVKKKAEKKSAPKEKVNKGTPEWAKSVRVWHEAQCAELAGKKEYGRANGFIYVRNIADKTVTTIRNYDTQNGRKVIDWLSGKTNTAKAAGKANSQTVTPQATEATPQQNMEATVKAAADSLQAKEQQIAENNKKIEELKAQIEAEKQAQAQAQEQAQPAAESAPLSKEEFNKKLAEDAKAKAQANSQARSYAAQAKEFTSDALSNLAAIPVKNIYKYKLTGYFLETSAGNEIIIKKSNGVYGRDFKDQFIGDLRDAGLRPTYDAVLKAYTVPYSAEAARVLFGENYSVKRLQEMNAQVANSKVTDAGIMAAENENPEDYSNIDINAIFNEADNQYKSTPEVTPTPIEQKATLAWTKGRYKTNGDYNVEVAIDRSGETPMIRIRDLNGNPIESIPFTREAFTELTKRSDAEIFAEKKKAESEAKQQAKEARAKANESKDYINPDAEKYATNPRKEARVGQMNRPITVEYNDGTSDSNNTMNHIRSLITMGTRRVSEEGRVITKIIDADGNVVFDASTLPADYVKALDNLNAQYDKVIEDNNAGLLSKDENAARRRSINEYRKDLYKKLNADSNSRYSVDLDEVRQEEAHDMYMDSFNWTKEDVAALDLPEDYSNLDPDMVRYALNLDEGVDSLPDGVVRDGETPNDFVYYTSKDHMYSKLVKAVEKLGKDTKIYIGDGGTELLRYLTKPSNGVNSGELVMFGFDKSSISDTIRNRFAGESYVTKAELLSYITDIEEYGAGTKLEARYYDADSAKYKKDIGPYKPSFITDKSYRENLFLAKSEQFRDIIKSEFTEGIRLLDDVVTYYLPEYPRIYYGHFLFDMPTRTSYANLFTRTSEALVPYDKENGVYTPTLLIDELQSDVNNNSGYRVLKIGDFKRRALDVAASVESELQGNYVDNYIDSMVSGARNSLKAKVDYYEAEISSTKNIVDRAEEIENAYKKARKEYLNSKDAQALWEKTATPEILKVARNIIESRIAKWGPAESSTYLPVDPRSGVPYDIERSGRKDTIRSALQTLRNNKTVQDFILSARSSSADTNKYINGMTWSEVMKVKWAIRKYRKALDDFKVKSADKNELDLAQSRMNALASDYMDAKAELDSFNEEEYRNSLLTNTDVYGEDDDPWDSVSWSDAEDIFEAAKRKVGSDAARRYFNDSIEKIADSPYSGSFSYKQYGLYQTLIRACAEGYDSISWSDADTQTERWGQHAAPEAYKITYDQDLVGIANKIGREYGVEAEHTSVYDPNDLSRTTGAWSMPITEEMRRDILKDGLPRYSIDLDADEEFNRQWDAAGKKYGTFEGTDVPRYSTRNRKVSSFANNVYSNLEMTDEIRQQLKEDILSSNLSYIPYPNAKAKAKAEDWISKFMDDNGNVNTVRAVTAYLLDFDDGKLYSADDVYKGAQLLAEIANKGDDISDADLANFSKIATTMRLIATQSGQVVQAMKAIKTAAPISRTYMIEQELAEYKRMLAKQKGMFYKQTTKQAQAMEEYEIPDNLKKALMEATNALEIEEAEQNIIDDIAKNIPADLMSRLTAWRYLSMLGNVKTHIRNVASNAIMYGIRGSRNAINSGLEDVFMKKYGDNAMRSISASAKVTKAHKEFANQVWQSVKDDVLVGGKESFKTRIEQSNNYNPFGKGKIANGLRKLSKFNDYMLGDVEDGMFLAKAYKQALASYMAANESRFGTDAVTYLSQEHSAESAIELAKAKEYALKEALEATYHDANYLASKLNEIENSSPVAKLLLGGLIPFKKTPFNVLKRAGEYSPLGLVRGVRQVINSMKQGKMLKQSGNQMVMTDEVADQQTCLLQGIELLSAGLTGTGIMLLGAWLAALGIIKSSGNEDDRLEYYDQMLGNQKYSANIAGTNITLDWATPAALVFFAGAEAANFADTKEISLNAVLDGITKIADPITNLSMLSGLNDALQSYGDKGLGAVAVSAGESFVSQFIPTLSGQAARIADNTRRTTYAAKDTDFIGGQEAEKFVNKLKNKIPGLSETNQPYVDMWGRTEENGSAFEQLASPWYSATPNKTAVDDYITQLYEATGDKYVVPTMASSYYTFDGKTYYLKPAEYTEAKTAIGSLSYTGIQSALESETFNSLTTDQQADVVKSIYSYATALAKYKYATTYNIKYESNYLKYGAKAAEAGMSIGEYLSVKQMISGIDPDKDSNGKTITTAKTKKTRILQTLGLTSSQIEAIL